MSFFKKKLLLNKRHFAEHHIDLKMGHLKKYSSTGLPEMTESSILIIIF